MSIRNLNYEYIKDTAHIDRIRSVITDGSAPIQFDTETTGLDPHNDTILLYQFGTGAKQFVVDNRFVSIKAFKDILEDTKRAKILHNAKFDYKMLKGEDITLECIRDTMLTEYCLTAGIQHDGRDLETVAAKYLTLKLDKEMQETFIGMKRDAVFSERQIAYAAADVTFLEDILRRQWVKVKAHGMAATAYLEFNVMPAFADMEYYGIPINREQWLGNASNSQSKLKAIMEELDEWACSRGYAQRNVMDEATINWASTKDVLTILNHQFRLKGTPAITSSDDDTLEQLWDKTQNPFIQMFREFRDLAKQNGTYGLAYLKHLNPKTGCIHPTFNQYGTATGRPSGSKPNMLNIPRDKKYREAFLAPDGFDVHTKDYSGAELRIVASMSNDPAMCEAYEQGKDLHTYVAAKFMERDYDTLNALVKAKDPEACEVRQAAKAINFGIIYGSGAAKFALDLKIPLEKSRGYVWGHKKEFAVMHKFLRNISIGAIENGYAATLLGRKRFFRTPPYPQHIVDAWEKAKKNSCESRTLYQYALWSIPTYKDYLRDAEQRRDVAMPFAEWREHGPGRTPEIIKFESEASAIMREAGNHPIQGGNADITKHAMVRTRDQFKARGYYPHAHIMLQVYDELAVLAPTKWRADVEKIVDDAMIECGKLVIQNIPVVVEGHIKQCWTK
jgi:DNA polymerase-1